MARRRIVPGKSKDNILDALFSRIGQQLFCWALWGHFEIIDNQVCFFAVKNTKENREYFIRPLREDSLAAYQMTLTSFVKCDDEVTKVDPLTGKELVHKQYILPSRLVARIGFSTVYDVYNLRAWGGSKPNGGSDGKG